MKHLCKVQGKLLLSFVLVLLLLVSITGCIKTSVSSEEKRYSDRVYISNHLFLSIEETSNILPDNYWCVGTIENFIPGNEPVETNNLSNCLPKGCELYLNPYLDLSDKESPVYLYAKIDGEKKYQIFSMMHAIK